MADAAVNPPEIIVRMAGQYIKDLSFENPNFRKLITSPGDQPNLKVEVNVGAEPQKAGWKPAPHRTTPPTSAAHAASSEPARLTPSVRQREPGRGATVHYAGRRSMCRRAR